MQTEPRALSVFSVNADIVLFSSISMSLLAIAFICDA